MARAADAVAHEQAWFILDPSRVRGRGLAQLRGSEFASALNARSDLEFSCALYRDASASEYVAEIETDGVDQNLPEWNAVQFVDTIPPGVPRSHVRWRQNLAFAARK